MRKMKANIVPLRFRDADEKEFYRILDALKEIYQEEADFLEPRLAGDELPVDVDAVPGYVDQCVYGNGLSVKDHPRAVHRAYHHGGGIADV